MYCCDSVVLPEGKSPGLWYGNQFQKAKDMAYGPIIDAREADAGIEVNRWILRAAVGAIVCGVALLLLGLTLTAHMASPETDFSSEIFETLAMAASRLVVAQAAFMVPSRLTPLALQV